MKIWVVLLIIAVVLLAFLVITYIVGNRMQKKQKIQQEQIETMSQTVSMLVIDKKRMKMKDAGFPKIVMDQIPKRANMSKVPIVKAKIGPKVTPLLCDELIYDQVPVKAEIKATVSGIYITGIKNLRNVAPPVEKKGFMNKLRKKSIEATRK